MSNLVNLLERFKEDPRTARLLEILDLNEEGSDQNARVILSGMIGSQECFALAGAFGAQNHPILFIANDKEDAAYVQNTLTNLIDQKVHFFPDSFKRPMHFEVINNENVLRRTSTMAPSASDKNGKIIISYPEALFEKVVAPQVLKEAKIELSVGESLDLDFLMEVLIEYGFQREEFVFEPGQFSIRGGIVDIFSYGNDWPYRVELFDEEVESIRTFDPTSQLSKQNISRVSIVPNVNTRFEQAQKVSLLNVLPKHAVVWIRDVQVLMDKTQICFEKALEFSERISDLEQSEMADLFRDRAFIQPHEILEDIRQFRMCLLSYSVDNTYFVKDSKFEKIEFSGKPQPSFNKNFNLLINDLSNNTSKGFENYIFTDNARQINRFESIFEDLNSNVAFHPITKSIYQGFIDAELKIACYTDHQIFQRFHAYRLRQGFTKDKAINLKMLKELKPGDFITHLDHGVGRYSGLEKLDINGHIQEAVRVVYANNDLLYISINSLHKISKYVGKEGTAPKLHRLGSDAWANMKRRTKRKIKDIAKDLIKLYAKRKSSKGFAFQPDGYLQNELEASFLYEDTPDQVLATQAVKEDMMKEYPMDRLICGDVGFGKTEIAIRAAFKSVVSGKQVAVLVPTTILALQHFKTFSDRLKEFGVTVDYINRFRTAKQKREIFQGLKEGKIDLVIGTHGLLNKDIGFKDLGLLIVDEEQKFGVAAKEKLRNLKVNVDTLILTATPIPRTLQFSLMAARDLSIMRTAPPNRQPIHTEQRIFSEELIKEAIYYEIQRGGQVFFVHNRVKTLMDMAGLIKRLCPDVDIEVAHGQMESSKLEKTLIDFIDRKFEVLVCTNIIETGLDIPNANTMIINNANHFGLSDLHQLRGRVGRSNKKAYCYLFSPPLSVLTPDARKRLKTLEEYSDLGSGFDIAMRDLDIRGAGNLLGGEQSGFINDIGYDTYQKILEEAIQELKSGEFKDLFEEEIGKQQVFVRDVEIDTDVEMLIPTEYVESTQERMNLYTELDSLENEEEVTAFEAKLADRFGNVPNEVKELFEGLKLRWIAKRLGFERIIFKNEKLRCYFVTDAQSAYYDSDTFQNIFTYIGAQGQRKGLNLKKSHNYLFVVKEGVRTLRSCREVLDRIARKVLD